MTNKQLLSKTENLFDRMGINKAAGGTFNLTDVNFGNMIPRPQVETMINLTLDHSQFLQSLNTIKRTRRSGEVPVYELTGPVMEYVGEDDPTQVTTQAATRNVPYTARKHKADIVITTDTLEEAAALAADGGDFDFEKTVVDSFTTQLGNDVADAAINGSRAFLATTRELRALRGVDGLDVLTNTGSNVFDANGKAFHEDVFPAIRDRIPWKYRRNTQDLRWLYNDRVATNWQNKLSKVATALGDQAKTNANVMPPMGIQPLIVPYISETDGPTAIAPTSVADNTTYIQAVLTTLVTAGDPASAALGVGRRFIVTCIATGVSEVCTGFLDTTLRINTTGLLGQAAVSGTANHYTVRPYDETTIYLGNPKGITVVWCNEWRAYREFNKDHDRFEITIYLRFCVLVPVPEAIVKYTNVAIPPLTWS